MGIYVFQKLECDCQKSLKDVLKMKRIALKKISETKYEAIYQCPECNRSIRITMNLSYVDYTKGIVIE